MNPLLERIHLCTLCQASLPNPPKPILSFDSTSRVLIIGQAPGQKAHTSGIPWNDASGEKLRSWLDVGPSEFYDTSLFGIVPMGFCFPGKGKSGDLRPRPECAPTWHSQILTALTDVQLILLIGSYAQSYYLKERSYQTLTENVSHYRDFLPEYFPLVHPSPRNRIWQKKNPWFEEEIIPELRKQVRKALVP